MAKGRIHIGTSGWHYKHWKGTFYPEGTKDADQLSVYLQHFKTVELNNSFYHLPATATFSKWYAATPPGFLFAVKASRFITHMKKLNVDKESINMFLDRVSHLMEKLGPVLLQLPPHWKINTERLAGFLARLPAAYRYTFEFRNPTWYHEEVYALLRQYNCAFCIYELAGHQSPMEVTADFVYIRLHGPGDKYQGSYTHDALKEWMKRMNEWAAEGKEVFIYFDNDQAGYSGFNAEYLAALAS